MCQATAKSAAGANWDMGDVTDNRCQHLPQGAVDDRTVKRGVADSGADRNCLPVDFKMIEPVDPVNVNLMGGSG